MVRYIMRNAKRCIKERGVKKGLSYAVLFGILKRYFATPPPALLSPATRRSRVPRRCWSPCRAHPLTALAPHDKPALVPGFVFPGARVVLSRRAEVRSPQHHVLRDVTANRYRSCRHFLVRARSFPPGVQRAAALGSDERGGADIRDRPLAEVRDCRKRSSTSPRKPTGREFRRRTCTARPVIDSRRSLRSSRSCSDGDRQFGSLEAPVVSLGRLPIASNRESVRNNGPATPRS